MDRESQENTLSEGIVLRGMFEEGMSLEIFEMVMRWLYTGSHEHVIASDSEELMELIVMANFVGLQSLVRVCELQLLKILAKYPLSAKNCIDFAER